MVGIRQRGPECYLSRLCLHGVIHRSKLSRDRIIRRIRKANFSTQTAGTHLLLHRRKIVLGDRKIGVDRIQTLDHQQSITRNARAVRVAVRTSWIYDVAEVDESLA